MSHPFEPDDDPRASSMPPPERLAIIPHPWWKRLMDIAGSCIALALSLPIMLVAAAAIRFTSRGPVFFSQMRSGRGGRPFRMYKLRSMVVEAETMKRPLQPFNEAAGTAFKMRDDPRVTLVGRFLRRWSIDERPQLFNVLRGDMSLVGPRPLPLDEIPCGLGLCNMDGHRCRLCIRPGLTCYWQVQGRSLLNVYQWFELDKAYLEDMSFWTDMKILLLTIPAVLSRDGAY